MQTIAFIVCTVTLTKGDIMKKLILLGALSVLLCSAPGYTSGHGTGDRNQALGGKEAAAPWERHNVPDQREDAIKEARRIRAAFVAAFAAALGVPAEEAPTPAAQKAEEAEAAKRRDQRVEDCWKEVDAQLALEVLPQKVDKAEGEAPAAAEEEAAAESR